MVRKWALTAAVLVAVVWGHSVGAQWMIMMHPGREMNEEQLNAGRDATIWAVDKTVTLTDEQKQKMRDDMEARDKAYMAFYTEHRPRLKELGEAIGKARAAVDASEWGDDNAAGLQAYRKTVAEYTKAIEPLESLWHKTDRGLENDVLTPEQRNALRQAGVLFFAGYQVMVYRYEKLTSIDRITPLSDVQKRKLLDMMDVHDKENETVERQLRQQERELHNMNRAFREDGDVEDKAERDNIDQKWKELAELKSQQAQRERTFAVAVLNALAGEQRAALKTASLAAMANGHVYPHRLDAAQVEQFKSFFTDLMEDESFGLPWNFGRSWDFGENMYERMRERALAMLTEDQRYELDKRDFLLNVGSHYDGHFIFGTRLTEGQRQRAGQVYDDVRRSGVVGMAAVIKGGEEIVHILTDEQRDAMVRNYLAFERRSDLVPEIGLAGEPKKQLEAAVKEKDKTKRTEQIAPIVRDMSVDQKNEILRRLWNGSELYREAD